MQWGNGKIRVILRLEGCSVVNDNMKRHADKQNMH